MGKRSGISWGDARGNARLLGLRGLVRRDRAVLGCVSKVGVCREMLLVWDEGT
jgi:hypothetical protein